MKVTLFNKNNPFKAISNTRKTLSQFVRYEDNNQCGGDYFMIDKSSLSLKVMSRINKAMGSKSSKMYVSEKQKTLAENF